MKELSAKEYQEQTTKFVKRLGESIIPDVSRRFKRILRNYNVVRLPDTDESEVLRREIENPGSSDYYFSQKLTFNKDEIYDLSCKFAYDFERDFERIFQGGENRTSSDTTLFSAPWVSVNEYESRRYPVDCLQCLTEDALHEYVPVIIFNKYNSLNNTTRTFVRNKKKRFVKILQRDIDYADIYFYIRKDLYFKYVLKMRDYLLSEAMDRLLKGEDFYVFEYKYRLEERKDE